MATRSYCDDPLGFMVARFDGDNKLIQSLEEVSQRQSRWAKIAFDERLAPRFLTTLSVIQSNVHHLLKEWLMYLKGALDTNMDTFIGVSSTISLEHIALPDMHRDSVLESRVSLLCNEI